jgi:YD repeat-containing protein
MRAILIIKNEDNYVYDGNGNMQCDLQNGIGFIVYDIFNQPVLVCKTADSPYEYSYDVSGNRIQEELQ